MCTKCSPTLEYMHFLFRRLQEFIWSPFVYIAGHLCIYLSVSHSAVLPVQFCGQLIHHYCRLGRASTWEHPVMRHTHTCCQPLMNTFFTTMLLHYAQPHVLSFPLCPITVSCCPTTVGKKKNAEYRNTHVSVQRDTQQGLRMELSFSSPESRERICHKYFLP